MKNNLKVLKQTFYQDLEILKQRLTNSSIPQQYYPSMLEELEDMFEKYKDMIQKQNKEIEERVKVLEFNLNIETFPSRNDDPYLRNDYSDHPSHPPIFTLPNYSSIETFQIPEEKY